MKLTDQELSQKIKELGYGVGFDLVGISALDPPDPRGSFSEWLRSGYAGEMEYMRRTALQRQHPREWIPWARSVISVGLSYASPAEVGKLPSWGEVSRYARGRDYHLVIQEKLELLLRHLEHEVEGPVRGKISVDSSPVLERAFAARSGLGWVGKNTLLISPMLGSYLFLGELFIDLDVVPDRPIRDRCGRCQRCLDACPTQAFVGPYILDARRCISYLTIELKGAIPRTLRPLVGGRIFGCDICQEVCPYNVRAPVPEDPSFLPGSELPIRDLVSLLEISEDEFKERFRDSPILRAKRKGLMRNVMVALGNTGDSLLVPFLTKILEKEPEPLVRGHAAWALGEIGTKDAHEILRVVQLTEHDSFVLEEVQAALEKIQAEKAAVAVPGEERL
jgi:epoxyqueuosine reductase